MNLSIEIDKASQRAHETPDCEILHCWSYCGRARGKLKAQGQARKQKNEVYIHVLVQ